MKALIVEDELLARVGMRSLIDWKGMGITLLEDAQDGKEARKRIEEEKPDILLLDLNIPEISGLELLRFIREQGLPVKTIVVSCYDDFDTVKEAMKLGAVDYIRKFGLSKDELTASLSSIIEIPRKMTDNQKSVAQNDYENHKKLESIPPEYQSGYCLSFYLLWKYAGEMTDLRIVETIVNQYFQGKGFQVLMLNYEGKLLAFLKDEVTQQDVEQLLRQIAPFVSHPCYIGTTACQNTEYDAKFFVKIANSIENYGFYEAGPQIIRLDQPVEIYKTYPFDVAGYLDQLDRGIQKISEKEILDALDQLFHQILEHEYLSVALVKQLMIEIVSRFSDKARSLGGAIEEIEVRDSSKHYQQIVYMTSFGDLRQWWKEFVHAFTVQFFTKQKKSESDIIESALEYIDNNLDKPIQLSDVARFIGVSEPYLSSFFKRNMNINFIPYVNAQKIKRARQLFAEGKMVYQVSEMLGFENSTYFSKVFKKIEGVTPEQYRKNLRL